ncbi:hypothetical protein BDV26DRAFT_264600 [Aspergillus bertholletiae]|uniref:Major facilitator superfamily (MFS) profile domain-containing protein n=1 Tax=Aspergillus bertholletiae TaxID=1226010 RepID=A0A5N7B4F8_9EURO|nr:hypothetical protein BDV26DRAFT_264600 [Aspergillus bertholletiae]
MNTLWMIVSRVINGIITGVLNAAAPVYGSWLAEYESHGQFTAIEFILNILGAVVAYCKGFSLGYIDHGTSKFQ